MTKKELHRHSLRIIDIKTQINYKKNLTINELHWNNTQRSILQLENTLKELISEK